MTGSVYNGPERRTTPEDRRGRLIYSHGPIVRALEVVSALSSVLAVAALIFAAVSFADTISLLQHSRRQAATDSCRVLHRLVDNAYPAVDRARANAILAQSGLGAGVGGCRAYATGLIRLRHGN